MGSINICKISASVAQKAYMSSGRDYAFADVQGMEAIANKGELWAIKQDNEELVIGGFAPMSARCAFTRALDKTGLFAKSDIVLLPIVCGKNTDIKPLLQSLFERVDTDNIKAILPVKSTGKNKLNQYFTLGMILIAMRPLHELRPYYIFECGTAYHINAADVHNMHICDSLGISRQLSDGYIGTRLLGNEIILNRRLNI